MTSCGETILFGARTGLGPSARHADSLARDFSRNEKAALGPPKNRKYCLLNSQPQPVTPIAKNRQGLLRAGVDPGSTTSVVGSSTVQFNWSLA